MARPLGQDLDGDLRLLEVKLKLLNREYEQYFLGNRPREPLVARAEVQKIVAYWSNLPIRNTAHRFRFGSLCSRYFSFRRKWDETLRKIEDGSYAPHQFKARLRERGGPSASEMEEAAAGGKGKGDDELFAAYREARESCGQSTDGLSKERFESVLRKQEAALREKYDCRNVSFRVVVENGKPRLKAAPIRATD